MARQPHSPSLTALPAETGFRQSSLHLAHCPALKNLRAGARLRGMSRHALGPFLFRGLSQHGVGTGQPRGSTFAKEGSNEAQVGTRRYAPIKERSPNLAPKLLNLGLGRTNHALA